MSNVKADRGGRVFLGGVGLLLASLAVYALAVDRSWYAVDGITRIAAESYGLVRWRFIAHVLGLSNGGMRAQSWAFVVFPVMFWISIVLLGAGAFASWRQRRHVTQPQRALATLEGRRTSSLASRQRALMRLAILLGMSVALTVVSLVAFRSSPPGETIANTQLTAGNWRLRLDEMRDDQRLMLEEGDLLQQGRFGELVSVSEAEAFVRQDALQHSQADAVAEARCAQEEDPGECRMLHHGLNAGRVKALSKPEVEARTAAVEREWRSALASYDLATILGSALSAVMLVLLAIGSAFTRRVVSAEFRGFDLGEDPLYRRYTALGWAALAAGGLVAISSIACAAASRPGGIAAGIVAAGLANAVGLIGIGRRLLSPRSLVRARNAQVAVVPAVALHDRTIQRDLAKLEGGLRSKRQYAATLQAAGSPPNMISDVQVEVHHLQDAAGHLRARLLGTALADARSKLRAASAQQTALRVQNAPAAAFTAVEAGLQAAKDEQARLATAAGWVPWPLTAGESGAQLAQRRNVVPIVAGLAVGAAVVTIAVFARPHDTARVKAPVLAETKPRIESTAHADPPKPVAPTSQAPPPADAAPVKPLFSLSSVAQLVKDQAASLTSTGAAFVESFEPNAVAFLPHSMVLFEGRDKIADGSHNAWARAGAPDAVDASDVVVGLFPNFAWATAQWKITLAGSTTVLPVRVTEVLVDGPAGPRVIAATFSVPQSGAAEISETAPRLAGSIPPVAEPDGWMSSPVELGKHVNHGDGTTLVGSDAKEFALGFEETSKMLAGWKGVQLAFVGNVRVVEGEGFRLVLGYVRWRGVRPVLFRTLGLFVPGDAMVGPAPWELATAHYSTASVPVPTSIPQGSGLGEVLVGKWDGSFDVSMHDPHGVPPPTETRRVPFEIAKRDGKLLWLGEDLLAKQHVEKPLRLMPGESGSFVDQSDPDSEVDTYSLVGDQLHVEVIIKGRYGGTATGVFHRAR